MKTLIIIFLFPVVTLAQVTLPMRTKKMEDVNYIVNELATKANQPYHIAKADTAVKAFKVVTYTFTNSDSTKNIYLKFFKGMDEVPYFEFRQVAGSYNDLFPFYKKFIDPTADIEATKKKEQNVVIWKVGDIQKRIVFYRSGSEWLITVRS
jgi:hypothetical protein